MLCDLHYPPPPNKNDTAHTGIGVNYSMGSIHATRYSLQMRWNIVSDNLYLYNDLLYVMLHLVLMSWVCSLKTLLYSAKYCYDVLSIIVTQFNCVP